MKKILEVLWYGDTDLRFDTDLKQTDLPFVIPEITTSAALTMLTKLWGGKENAVIAAIRALAIADLGLCAHREDMIRYLDHASLALVHALEDAKEAVERGGGKVITYAPGVPPPKMPS